MLSKKIYLCASWDKTMALMHFKKLHSLQTILDKTAPAFILVLD